MYYPPATRRVTLSTAVAIFIIVSLTYHSSFGLSGTLVATTATCQIWPDWQGSSPKQLRYEDCGETVRLPQVGDINTLGSPRRCLSASSRLEQYSSPSGRNWSQVKWGQVQRRCAAHTTRLLPVDNYAHQIWRRPADSQQADIATKGKDDSIAVVLRTWDNFEYTEKRLVWLRALIAEVALHRDKKYQVYFLVNIKDTSVDLKDDATYEKLLRKVVPEEFRDMALLFNERTLLEWYPLVEEHGAQDQMYQALQIFSHKFQQYDYIWQLEMDLRFTGHVHDTLQSATDFARTQRRRNLWERNGRFYIPYLYNNSYDAFSNVVDEEIGDNGVWGPVTTSGFEPQGPLPPSRVKWNWGVGEEADLISFMPMIDPVGTNWVYEDGIHGFTDGTETPRRAAIVSITRSSRRLLQLISTAQQEKGQWLVSEATLETFALLHGLKAVTVPHPIYFADEVKVEDVDAEINKGPLHSKAGGESPSMLYMKTGWIAGPWWKASYWFTAGAAAEIWEAYVGGQSLPPMLLHPVKEK